MGRLMTQTNVQITGKRTLPFLNNFQKTKTKLEELSFKTGFHGIQFTLKTHL